jgi:hypothetical protein
MRELTVPKRKAEVQLLLPGGTRRSVQVFLAEFAHDHPGPERLSDLLNAGGQFLPVLDLADEQMLFVNRAQIAAAFVSAELEQDPAVEHTIPLEQEVRVRMADGQVLEGLLAYVLPPDRERTIDFLNASAPFFRLLQPPQVGLINKQHVEHVEVRRP